MTQKNETNVANAICGEATKEKDLNQWSKYVITIHYHLFLLVHLRVVSIVSSNLNKGWGRMREKDLTWKTVIFDHCL